MRRAAFVWVPGWVDARAQINHWSVELPHGWKASKIFGGGPKSATDARHVEALFHRLELGFVVVLQLGQRGLILALHGLHLLPHIAEIVGFGGSGIDGESDAARGEA